MRATGHGLASMGVLSVLAAVVAGVAGGVGGYTFLYAKGASYMTDDPAACANCHVMHAEFDGWVKGSHRKAAVCNDCHTPPGLVAKYFTKALNGWHHSQAFTTGDFPDVIRIKDRNRAVTEGACRKCHQAIVDAVDGPHGGQGKLECLRCHPSVGHME